PECLLQIDDWNFHWQGSYGFKQPKIFNPGDKLYLECHWDNSAGNQTGVPKDTWWGEGTTDEMCLGGFYYTKEVFAEGALRRVIGALAAVPAATELVYIDRRKDAGTRGADLEWLEACSFRRRHARSCPLLRGRGARG